MKHWGRGKWPATLHRQLGTSMWPLSHKAAHDHSSIEMSAAGIQGLQATYNQVFNEVGVPPAWELEAIVQPPSPSHSICFWAPITKWGLVCTEPAGMARPAEKLSTAEATVLATGFIWSRYSLVIIPKNWRLLAVNSFAGTAGASELSHIWRYNQELKAKANK